MPESERGSCAQSLNIHWSKRRSGIETKENLTVPKLSSAIRVNKCEETILHFSREIIALT